jgi:uncharacterized membrane protein
MNNSSSCAAMLSTMETADSSSHSHKNVGDVERAASVGAGAALLLTGLLLAGDGAALAWRGYKGHCAAYSALGIDTAHSHRPAEPEDFYERGVLIHSTVTINAEPQRLYDFWRKLENLPQFMSHLEEVRVIDATRSHWVAKGPAGKRVEWDAEIINDEAPVTIAWRTIENAEVEHTGSVRFVAAPGRGTQVKVRMEYLPPAGKLTNAFLKLIGQDPRTQIKEDLHRFKQLIEAGEIPTTEGQPKGSLDSKLKPRNRSRPAELLDHAGASPDPVTEASMESFPASDPPAHSSAHS